MIESGFKSRAGYSGGPKVVTVLMHILCFETRKSPPTSIVAEERQALALLGLPLGNFAVCFLVFFVS